MPNFQATNKFNCPHCHEMLNGAAAFTEREKPQDNHFTICSFCAELSVYVITKEGVISLRKLQDEDYLYIKNHGLEKEIEEMKAFVKTKPQKQ